MNITRKLNQTAIYWANSVNDGFGGFTFDAPVDIAVRWEDKQEKYISMKGEEQISNALVYLSIDVKVGEYLMLGTLDDQDSSPDPQKEDTAFRIMAILKSPNVKATNFLRKVWL
jgi:hypothetical protein